MTINATTYVGFRGNAREALTFYREVFGGDFQIGGWDRMCADNHELGEDDSANQRMNLVIWVDDAETMTAQF